MHPTDVSASTTVCPSGQGDGPEIHWALPAGVRIPSLSTSQSCDDTGGTSWPRDHWVARIDAGLRRIQTPQFKSARCPKSQLPACPGSQVFDWWATHACMVTPVGYGYSHPTDFPVSTTVCPSGQGDGPEIHWALPAGVRIPSLSHKAQLRRRGWLPWSK